MSAAPPRAVAVLGDGPRIRGFLAYETDSERVGWPLGRMVADVQGIVAEPGFECDLRRVVRALGICTLRFDHVLRDQTLFAPFHRSLHQSPVVDLSHGHEAYVNDVRSRSNRVITDIARRSRNLARKHGDVVVQWHSTRPEDLTTLIDWKSEQYRRTQGVDLFAYRWATSLLGDLTGETASECRGLVVTLRAGDQLIAADYGLAGGGTLAWWFPVYDPAFGRYSPGLILLLALAAQAAEHGVRFIDLGRGESGYKLRVANSSYTVAEGRVPAIGAAFRTAIRLRHPGWAPRKAQSILQGGLDRLRSPRS